MAGLISKLIGFIAFASIMGMVFGVDQSVSMVTQYLPESVGDWIRAWVDYLTGSDGFDG